MINYLTDQTDRLLKILDAEKSMAEAAFEQVADSDKDYFMGRVSALKDAIHHIDSFSTLMENSLRGGEVES